MIRAVVRSGERELHFVGEMNGYNLETLEEYARATLTEWGSADVDLQIDSADFWTWNRRASRWLARLSRAGAAVHVAIASSVADEPGEHGAGRITGALTSDGRQSAALSTSISLLPARSHRALGPCLSPRRHAGPGDRVL